MERSETLWRVWGEMFFGFFKITPVQDFKSNFTALSDSYFMSCALRPL
jgi:hypothetical protein